MGWAEVLGILRLHISLPLLLIVVLGFLILNDPADGQETADPESATEVAVDSEDPEIDTEYAGDQAEDEQRPLLQWRGESPHWVPGREFSAVVGAPFIGSYECTLCHKELKSDFLHTAHARTLLSDALGLSMQGCEMCHGAGGAHAVLRSRGTIFAFDWADTRHADNICLRCHSWLTSDHEWLRTTHSKAGVACIKCHNPHQPQRAGRERFLLVEQQDRLCATCHQDVANEFTRFSHHPVKIFKASEPGARAMHCTSCHDVHRSRERAMLPTRRVNDLCATCHAEKAGPFVFEHMGAQEGISDGCLTCHAQHGSHSPALLITDGRALCMQCHTDKATHNQPLTCWTTGCHTDVHGSNHSLLLLGELQ